MNVAIRMLGLDRAKWVRVGPGSLWPGVAFAVSASFLMALNRFGGLIIDTPRAFTRLALVGIYGWLGLSLALWGITTASYTIRPRGGGPVEPPGLTHTIAGVGIAHSPVLVLGMVIFAAANLLQILGPGKLAAMLILGFWFPAALVTAARYSHRLSWPRAVATAVVPYLLWLLVVGRHLMGQVEHLL